MNNEYNLGKFEILSQDNVTMTTKAKDIWKRIVSETNITTYDNFCFNICSKNTISFGFNIYECFLVDLTDTSILDDNENGIEITDDVVIWVGYNDISKFCTLEDFLKLDCIKK